MGNAPSEPTTKDVRTVILGLDASGKTSLLYKLKLGEVVHAIPQVGFNVETIEHGGVSFTMWDVGGQDKLRPLWRHYFLNTDYIIFVVDSTDVERVYEARHELHKMFVDDNLRDAGLLVFANKQDLPDAMRSTEISDILGLSHLGSRDWFIQPSNTMTGDGLYEGLDWIVTMNQRRTGGQGNTT
eukprot:TRINITY_DN26821_c0_g1_i1.p1 TRINITY_DN26821_c0_g1~~TRINITY_DN26821_c0_g1_i1.p1  ORF type:complete len:184 (+),score=20.17 TRINITY_DN26821_c0_g1_i1:466-1017(+)